MYIFCFLPEPTSGFQTFFSVGKTQNVGNHFLNGIVRNIFVIKFLGYAEINIFIAPTPVVSVLEDRHIMQRHHRCDIICNQAEMWMKSQCKLFYSALKMSTLKK